MNHQSHTDMSNHQMTSAADSMLRGVVGKLNSLADSFDDVGNSKVADQLESMALKISDARALYDTARSNGLDASLKQAQEGCYNTFRGVMAGMAIKTTDQVEKKMLKEIVIGFGPPDSMPVD